MKLFFFFFLICFIFNSVANARGTTPASSGTFDVKNFGARANGWTDDSRAFMAAWKAACSSSGVVMLLVPKGTYIVGPVKFSGPCKNVQSLTVQMKGYLKASTDLSRYVKGNDWIEFGWVDRLTLRGGTFDGQGAASWPYNKCPTNINCKVLPTSIMFTSTTNTRVRGITSLNSKFFHIALLGVKNFQGSDIKISAPANSPNTDGIHIERSSGISIQSSMIQTGDDCISIGQGNSQVFISNIICGPGHGISVGSLGKYRNEGDVRDLIVKDSTISGTMNGLRIKTWANSPGRSRATNMTFDNIVMKSVGNPIIIDQTYCPYTSCSSGVPSRVKLSDISFRNIQGTSTTPVAVTLQCSKGYPCQNINLHNVQLKYMGGTQATSTCLNVQARYSGTQNPPPCGSA